MLAQFWITLFAYERPELFLETVLFLPRRTTHEFVVAGSPNPLMSLEPLDPLSQALFELVQGLPKGQPVGIKDFVFPMAESIFAKVFDQLIPLLLSLSDHSVPARVAFGVRLFDLLNVFVAIGPALSGYGPIHLVSS